MRVSQANSSSLRRRVFRPARLAAICAVIMAFLAGGCGKRQSSYKDRIGTIDPATVPIEEIENPAAQKKQK
jgi:hypothetical protein